MDAHVSPRLEPPPTSLSTPSFYFDRNCVKIYIYLEELTLLLCCLQIYKPGISLHLSRSLFWGVCVCVCVFSQLGNSLRTGNCDNGGAPFIFSLLSKVNVFLPCFRWDSKSDPCYSILHIRGSLKVILSSLCIFIFKL